MGAEEEGRHARPGRHPRRRARLLPRAPVSKLRQPRASRRRLPQRQGSLRRRARGRARRHGRLSGFCGCDRRLGEAQVREKYGNLFDMYEEITGENAYKVPMRIFPAVHYTMGGLWVDYQLMSTIPGLFVAGEANFSDHGANRPWRQRSDAGPCRRIFHSSVHASELHRVRPRWKRLTPRTLRSLP